MVVKVRVVSGWVRATIRVFSQDSSPGVIRMWERNKRNTEIKLQEGVKVQIVNGPVLNGGVWEVQVKVINQTGHRLPTGYPDGRRLWVHLQVFDAAGGQVYESGHYDPATARLYTDNGMTGFNRALSPVIDATAQNAVMVYERVTGTGTFDPVTGDLTSCVPSPNLLNDMILFDNRIPPFGFNYTAYREAGVKFWAYDPANFIPYEDSGRYPDGQNWDLITYRFPAGVGTPVSASAEVCYQSHTREFVEHLRAQDTSTLRPEGPPRVWALNYPLDPNYLSQEFGLAVVEARMKNDGWLAPTERLNDNWGGIQYAAWYVTGKGAPFVAAVADTTDTVPPAPNNLRVFPEVDPVTGQPVGGVIDPVTGLLQPYTQLVTWDPVVNADGYLVWIRYGTSDTTAHWDKLAIVYDDGNPVTRLELTNTAINVNKTYAYKVQAFNGAGYSPESVVVAQTTPWDLPLPPENLKFVSATATSITMSWADVADNEDGFIISRQDAGVVGAYTIIARIPSQTPGGLFGGNTWTDETVAPERCYNYIVEAYNASGSSGPNVNGPVQMCTILRPNAPIALTAVANSPTQVTLSWTDNANNETGFVVERASGIGGVPAFSPIATINTPNTVSYVDNTVLPNSPYTYRIMAFNTAGNSPYSPVATVTTPDSPPAAPTLLTGTLLSGPLRVSLTWLDNANNETGFVLERSVNGGAFLQIATPGPRVGTGSMAYTDTAVSLGNTYRYRVRAVNAFGSSAYSNTVTVNTPPSAPTGLAGSAVRITGNVLQDRVTLNWTDTANNETGFQIQRALAASFLLPTTFNVGANVTTFQQNVSRILNYYYRVRAVNATGNSAWSNVIFVDTP